MKNLFLILNDGERLICDECREEIQSTAIIMSENEWGRVFCEGCAKAWGITVEEQ